MENSKIRKISLYAVLVIVIVFIVIAVIFVLSKKEDVKLDSNKIVPVPINGITATTAYDLALGEALKWSSDAKLANLETTASTSVIGTSDDWLGMFVSASKAGKGYSVSVKNKAVSEAAEVPYLGNGESMPEQLISSEEAIVRFHQLPAYKNESVLGVEVFYGPDGKQWYWGIKTKRGVVTINARK